MALKRTPSNLSDEAGRWWRKIQKEYEIFDEGGLLILQVAFEAFDRMRGAQEIIDSEGVTFVDRFGQVKAHPLCSVERDARSQMLAALKSLNLDMEPIKDIGRPGGSY